MYLYMIILCLNNILKYKKIFNNDIKKPSQLYNLKSRYRNYNIIKNKIIMTSQKTIY
jgi:hypothetical protein